MRKLKFYIRLLNMLDGNDLSLIEADGSYLVSGKLRELINISLVNNSSLVLIETLKRMDKYAKAVYELQMWKGAQALNVLVEAGIREDVAVELVGQCIRSGKDPEMLSKHPTYVKAMAEQLQELMDRD